MENVGVVKELYPQKGWGFIEMECGSDIFFHRINLVGNFRELAPGTPVEFTIGKDARQRRQALNVRPF